MFIKENIMLAIAGLKANKMRALLTMLGIIIGIASVIGVVTVGNTMTSSVESSMASMGATNITVNVQEKSEADKAKSVASKNETDTANSNVNKTDSNNTSKGGNKQNSSGNQGGAQGGKPGGMGSSGGASGMLGMLGGGGMKGGRMSRSTSSASDNDLMTMSQINALQENFSDKISAISISETGDSGKVKSDTSYANVSITGTNAGYQDVKNLTLTGGRYFNQNDIDGAKNVAVVSDKLVTKIFGNSIDPIGKPIKFYTSDAIFTYYIVGVYKYQASGGSRTTSDETLSTNLYIPITVEKKTATNKNYQMFQIKSNDNVDIVSFTNELSTYLSDLYAKNIKFVAQASNMESMLESRTTMMNNVKLAISGIAGISLLVGGIGVMNIMLVSVTERTREIGTRKALGAKGSHIKMQFIVESVIICSIGGLLGVGLGLGAGTLGTRAMGYSMSISPLVILISFSFSMFIGVFFGYYPAKKAAELDPIEALRYE